MRHQDQTPLPEPLLEWHSTAAGEVPVSVAFGDPYFSLAGGLAETAHVFHRGNGLPERFRPGFQIAELGFGTGLNLLASWALWEASGQGGSLRYTSFEAFPMSVAQTAQALAAFPQLAPRIGRFLAALDRQEPGFALGPVQVEIIAGDARQTLPHWKGRADAWFLDGFSPARNPELWSAALLAEVGRHTVAQGSFATYTAAGHVRRGLQEAGFAVDRSPGFGHKRHMSAGRLAAG